MRRILGSRGDGTGESAPSQDRIATAMSVRARLGRLRPGKVRRAVRRRVFERAVRRSARLDPGPRLVRLGTDYGGWSVPDGRIGPDWVCYCVGAGADISFDLGLIERFGCRVWCFDPAEGSREYVEPIAAATPRLEFHQLALWTTDASVEMYRAADETHCSLSTANLQATQDSVQAPGRSLRSLMAELGHARVDLLKADLEGSEYEVLDPAELAELGVQVLCFEVHHTVRARKALEFLEGFRAVGFRPIHQRDMQFTLVRDAPGTA
jgi:FkbM family methyltransferase